MTSFASRGGQIHRYGDKVVVGFVGRPTSRHKPHSIVLARLAIRSLPGSGLHPGVYPSGRAIRMWSCPTAPGDFYIGRQAPTGAPVDYSRIVARIPAGLGRHQRETAFDGSGHAFV